MKPQSVPSLANPKARRTSESSREQCVVVNLTETDSKERFQCTPGSMYIVRCRECICPYSGDINLFCRPLKKGVYCEQAFPGYNFIIQRRQKDDEQADAGVEVLDTRPPSHSHTAHRCYKPGRILDDCFICECEDREMVVIEEHCFKSNAKHCKDAEPDFIRGGTQLLYDDNR